MSKKKLTQIEASINNWAMDVTNKLQENVLVIYELFYDESGHPNVEINIDLLHEQVNSTIDLLLELKTDLEDYNPAKKENND